MSIYRIKDEDHSERVECDEVTISGARLIIWRGNVIVRVLSLHDGASVKYIDKEGK